MTNIPGDIMRLAERTLDAVLCVCSSDDGGADYVRSESINNIARVILAERQACEKIARHRAASWFEEPTSSSTARAAEAEKIADLIAARSTGGDAHG